MRFTHEATNALHRSIVRSIRQHGLQATAATVGAPAELVQDFVDEGREGMLRWMQTFCRGEGPCALEDMGASQREQRQHEADVPHVCTYGEVRHPLELNRDRIWSVDLAHVLAVDHEERLALRAWAASI